MTEDRIERPELREYRLAARDWLARNVASVDGTPDDDSPSPERVEYLKRTQAKLYEAGFALAGLLTSARRDGDNFVVNGQKIWSTGAHLSDFALCPVRTKWDVPKHKGISVLIIDLQSPGIEVRRIQQINGAADFCEEF